MPDNAPQKQNRIIGSAHPKGMAINQKGIVGMGTDENGKYFQFVDKATSDRSTGASYSCRLYYNSTTVKITGKMAIIGYRSLSGTSDDVITQVCKRVKKDNEKACTDIY